MDAQEENTDPVFYGGASLVAQMMKNLHKTQVRSLFWEDSPGEGNGYLLQYSCLENFMVRGAWQVGVAKSWTGVPKICGHKTAR